MAKASQFAQSRAEVEALIARIGELHRAKVRRGLEYGGQIADLKQVFDADIEALDRQIDEAEAKVRVWCVQNRAAICKGRSKTAHFATGEVKFRAGRLVVLLTKSEDAILDYLRRKKLTRFIRVKEEVNKTALAGEPEIAETIPGVTLQRAPEQILIEPTAGNVDSGRKV